jgi:hypothetical protein
VFFIEHEIAEGDRSKRKQGVWMNADELQEFVYLGADAFELRTKRNDVAGDGREPRKICTTLGTMASQGWHDGNPPAPVSEGYRETFVLPQSDPSQSHGRLLVTLSCSLEVKPSR